MTSEELFEHYYYLVERYAIEYNLDEDSQQDMALYLWKLCQRLPAKNLVTCLHSRLSRWAQRNSVKSELPEVDFTTACLEGRYSELLWQDRDVARDTLSRCIAKLPNSCRRVIELRFFVGLDANETAEEMNVCVTYVHSLTKSSLIRLWKMRFAHSLNELLDRYENVLAVKDGMAYL